MEPECSLPHSQVPATCPYSNPARSSPYTPHTTSWRSILILSSHLRLGLRRDLILQSDNIVYVWYKSVGFLAISYGWAELSLTKVNRIFVYPVVNLQKLSYKKKSHSWTRFHWSRKNKCVLNTCCKRTKTILQDCFFFPQFRWQAGVMVNLKWGINYRFIWRSKEPGATVRSPSERYYSNQSILARLNIEKLCIFNSVYITLL